MKPGRELDEAVAHEVFGLVPCDQWFCNRPGTDEWFTRDCPHNGCCYPVNLCWSYSTRIDLGMSALTWVEVHHPWTNPRTNNRARIILGRSRDNAPSVAVMGGAWHAGFPLTPYGQHGAGGNFLFTGETYEHAICLAALAAARELRR